MPIRLLLTGLSMLALIGCHAHDGGVVVEHSVHHASIVTVADAAADGLDPRATDAAPLAVPRPGPRVGERLLVDFRLGPAMQVLPTTLPGAMAHALLSEPACSAKVMGSAEGSFTFPGRQETLLGIGFECPDPDPDSAGMPVWSKSGRLAVVDADGNVVAERDVPGYTIYTKIAADTADVDSVIMGANTSDAEGTVESAFIVKLTPRDVTVAPLGKVWIEKNNSITGAVAYASGRGAERRVRLEYSSAPSGTYGSEDSTVQLPLDLPDWRAARDAGRPNEALDDALHWTLVTDFRRNDGPPDPRLSKDEEARITKALSPRDRKRVDDVWITRGPSGAFTARGAQEDLYIVAGQENGQPRGVILSWIVLGQGALLRRPILAPGFILEKVGDIDGDGFDEIVLGDSGGTHQGYTLASEALLDLRGGRLVVTPLGDTSDNCGTGIAVESDRMSYVVFTARGADGARRVRRRFYRQWCYRAVVGGPFVPSAAP